MGTDVGAMLVEGKVITRDQFQLALAACSDQTGTLVHNLVRLKVLDEDTLAIFLSQKFNLPMAIPLQFENLPKFLVRLVPASLTRQFHLMPIMLHQEILYLAMSDPTDRKAMEEVSMATGYKTFPVVMPVDALETYIEKYYGAPPRPALAPVESLVHMMTPSLKPKPVSPLQGPSGPSPSLPVSVVAESAADEPPTDHLAVPFAPLTFEELAELPADSLETQPPDPDQESTLEIRVDSFLQDETSRQLDSRLSDGNLDPATSGNTSPEEYTSPRLETLFSAKPESRALTPEEPPVAGPQKPPVAPYAPGLTITTPLPRIADPKAAIAQLAAADKADLVAQTLIQYGSSLLNRVILFRVKREFLVGWTGTGEGISPEQTQRLIVPIAADSIFAGLLGSHGSFEGPFVRKPGDEIFLKMLGPLKPGKVWVHCLWIQNKVICLLYGDSGSRLTFLGPTQSLEEVVSAAEQAFTRLVRKKKRSEPDSGL